MTRLLLESEHETGLTLCHVNEIEGDAAAAAYLLEFDSVHGRWHDHSCCGSEDGTAIRVTRSEESEVLRLREIQYTSVKDPAAVPWGNVDILIECTGQHKTLAKLEPILASASKMKKIVVSAPVKDEGVPNIVVGVNDNAYDPLRHSVVTVFSCTTNAIAPVVKVLHDRIGIKHGMITTIHNLTNTQTVLDHAWPGRKEIRRTRSAGLNLIPTTTGSAKAITQIFPELKGQLDGSGDPSAHGSWWINRRWRI